MTAGNVKPSEAIAVRHRRSLRRTRHVRRLPTHAGVLAEHTRHDRTRKVARNAARFRWPSDHNVALVYVVQTHHIAWIDTQ